MLALLDKALTAFVGFIEPEPRNLFPEEIPMNEDEYINYITGKQCLGQIHFVVTRTLGDVPLEFGTVNTLSPVPRVNVYRDGALLLYVEFYKVGRDLGDAYWTAHNPHTKKSAATKYLSDPAQRKQMIQKVLQ